MPAVPGDDPARARTGEEHGKDKKPFVLVSVSADDEKETLDQVPGEGTDAVDPLVGRRHRSAVLKKYPRPGLPDPLPHRPHGRDPHKWVGKPDSDKLDKAVEELVKEAEKAKG